MNTDFNQQPAFFPPQQAPKSTSGLGIAALVLGIVALVISWVPIVNNFAFIVGVVGLVLGLFAIHSTRPAGKNSGRGISIAGTVLCILSLIIVLVTQFIYSQVLDEVSKTIEKSVVVANEDNKDKDNKDNSSSNDENKNKSGLVAGKYLIENVQVKKIGIDYEGKPTVVVSYEMTNKSDERSNALDVHVKVFQNKAGLEPALYMDTPSGYDNESQFKEILPGGKKTVTEGFVLSNEKDPVIVEIVPTLDFNDDSPKVMKEFPLE